MTPFSRRHEFARLGEFAVAAALDGDVDDDRARAHRLHHVGGHEARSRTAGNQGGRDDDILLGDVRGNQRRLLGLIGVRHFLGVAAGGFGLLELVVLDGDEFCASNSTCSLVAGRTSVAVTIAPRRRPVAIAWRPATPTPMTKSLAAGTVPAGVIIIGSARPYSAAASRTARYPARLAWLDRTSITCARVMRGINSMANAESAGLRHGFDLFGVAVGVHGR